MSLTENIDSAIKDIEVNFDGGLSNTSTKKFNGLAVAISEISGVPVDDIYITSVYARASNTWNRLSQGKPLARHFRLGVCISSPDGVNGVLAPLGSFIGDGNVHYDNVAVIAKDSDDVWRIKAIATNARDSVSIRCQDHFQDSIIKLVNVVPNYVKEVVERSINPKEVQNQKASGKKRDVKLPIQVIYYGAPGTGKSRAVKEALEGAGEVYRTTFHPDTDYAGFVGAYKPAMEARKKYGLQGQPIKVDGQDLEEGAIVYRFVPQVFTKAYVKAWEEMAKGEAGREVFLVVEEINRGNCAQVFGDLFQLLDRDGDTGESEYPIAADEDLKRYLAEAFTGLAGGEGAVRVPKTVRNGEELVLPPNLHIWATMNTSDQSLFPMDGAFKRRWEWKYVPIADAGLGWAVEAGGGKWDWWDFLEKVNGRILEAEGCEDKQLGYFFARPDGGGKVIGAETLVGKVVAYLFQDVFRDEVPESVFPKEVFAGEGAAKGAEGPVSFRRFFRAGEAGAPVDGAVVRRWLEKLDVAKAAEADEGGTGGE